MTRDNSSKFKAVLNFCFGSSKLLISELRVLITQFSLNKFRGNEKHKQTDELYLMIISADGNSAGYPKQFLEIKKI